MTTAQEHEQEYIASVGKELGTLYYALYHECKWLHWTWRE